MKYLNAFICLFFLSLQTAVAADIEGYGWGDTADVAKREALLDISTRISVTLRSSSKSVQTSTSHSIDNKKTEDVSLQVVSSVEANSELPILGANFSFKNQGQQIMARAVLESSRSLVLYEKKLDELHKRMMLLNTSIGQAGAGEAQYNSLMDMFTLLDEFKKLNTVVIYLGGKQHDQGINEEVLRNHLRVATKQVDTLDLAAKLLAKGIDEAGVYIFPAKARNSNEITPFAALLKDKLAVNLKPALSPREASFTLVGEYLESADGIDLVYHLLDKSAVAQKTNMVHISKQAYAGMQTVPKTVDFEKLLYAGVAVSSNMHAEISTSFGGHDLLFTQGDEVELFVKLSEMGYFYVVGHTVKESESNSYLMEASEAKGARKFIHFVNADDANKWISIGKFEVAPPFGVEGLQVIASSLDLVDSLPAANLDSSSGLYMVAAAPKEGVIKTRALIKKFPKNAQTSEATLMFTTKTK